MAWIELMAVALAGVVGWWSGRRLGGGRWWWAAGMACAAVLVGIFVGHRWVRGSFMFPLSWLVEARANPVLLSTALSMLMTVVLVRVPARRLRRLVGAMAVAVVIYAAVWPQAVSVWVRPSLAHIRCVCSRGRTLAGRRRR
jgi:hypothetical protein